jgi:hypothetical protein
MAVEGLWGRLLQRCVRGEGESWSSGEDKGDDGQSLRATRASSAMSSRGSRDSTSPSGPKLAE